MAGLDLEGCFRPLSFSDPEAPYEWLGWKQAGLAWP